jgi:hypothetical protein
MICCDVCGLCGEDGVLCIGSGRGRSSLWVCCCVWEGACCSELGYAVVFRDGVVGVVLWPVVCYSTRRLVQRHYIKRQCNTMWMTIY